MKDIYDKPLDELIQDIIDLGWPNGTCNEDECLASLYKAKEKYKEFYGKEGNLSV